MTQYGDVSSPITSTCIYNFRIAIIIWRLACQKQVSREGTSNCIPQILWDAITCPCPLWFNNSKTFIWQRKYMFLDNNPSIVHFVRSKPISYNIHWGKHCGHWTLIGQLHRERQSMLHSINAFRIDIFVTSGDSYQGLWCRYHKGHRE